MTEPSLVNAADAAEPRPADMSLGPPTYWPIIPADDAGYVWADLRDWVDQLVDRFALDARTVPPCWFRHNRHVEALSALYDYERMSFHATEPPGGAVDFMRALRDIERLLTEWSGHTQCSINEHRPDPQRAWQTADDDWHTFVEDDIARRESHNL
jgi:hypothetical protein